MEQVFGCFKVVVIAGAAVIALLLVLLSLPKSRLRSVLFEAFFWAVTAAAVVLVVSPVDTIPDIFVGLGQLDDLMYVVGSIGSAMLAVRQRRQRRSLPSGEEPAVVNRPRNMP
jgi:hypothetical protein